MHSKVKRSSWYLWKIYIYPDMIKSLKENQTHLWTNGLCIYFFSFHYFVIKAPWRTLGCFKDTSTRAIPSLEGTSPFLDGEAKLRSDALTKCYKAAAAFGYKCFAVQNGGQCLSSDDACNTYDVHGTSTGCRPDGEGAFWANQVYEIQGNCELHPLATYHNLWPQRTSHSTVRLCMYVYLLTMALAIK